MKNVWNKIDLIWFDLGVRTPPWDDLIPSFNPILCVSFVIIFWCTAPPDYYANFELNDLHITLSTPTLIIYPKRCCFFCQQVLQVVKFTARCVCMNRAYSPKKKQSRFYPTWYFSTGFLCLNFVPNKPAKCFTRALFKSNVFNLRLKSTTH